MARVVSVTFVIKTRVLREGRKYKVSELRMAAPKAGGAYITIFFPSGRIVGCEVSGAQLFRKLSRVVDAARNAPRRRKP